MRVDRDKLHRQFDMLIDEKFSDFRVHYELNDFVYNKEMESQLYGALDSLIDVMVEYMEYQFNAEGNGTWG